MNWRRFLSWFKPPPVNKPIRMELAPLEMKITPAGLEHIKTLEGSRSQMYLDSAGLPTIGVGHLLTQSEYSSGKINIDGQAVRWKSGLSGEQISALLAQDLFRFERVVNEEVGVPLSREQFDALVSFSFNVGVNAFSNSTLLRKLNSGDYSAVAPQMRRWTRAGGRFSKGLENRRESEVRLFDYGQYV